MHTGNFMSLQAPVQHRGPFSDSVHAALPQIYPMETIILLIITLTLLHTRSLNTTHNHGILLAIMTTLTHMILVICIMYILGCCWFFSITGILKILQTSRMVLFLSMWSFLEMCYTRSAWIIPSRPVLDQQQGRSRGPSIYQRSAVRLNDLLAWKCAVCDVKECDRSIKMCFTFVDRECFYHIFSGHSQWNNSFRQISVWSRIWTCSESFPMS